MRHNNTPSKSSFRDWLSIDTGMVVVVFICIMYLVLVFGLLFYVKNEWCDLLFKNMTVSIIIYIISLIILETRFRYFYRKTRAKHAR